MTEAPGLLGAVSVAATTELWPIPWATVNQIAMEAFDSFTRARAGQPKGGTPPATDDDLREALVCAEVDGVLRPQPRNEMMAMRMSSSGGCGGGGRVAADAAGNARIQRY